jgi:hypothetical protein
MHNIDSHKRTELLHSMPHGKRTHHAAAAAASILFFLKK